MPKNAIVLGMARSGTSLTASIFATHGYNAAFKDDLVPGDHLNPTGYFEAESLLKENENILRATGFQYDNTWIYERITDEQLEKLKDIELNERQHELIAEFEKIRPWVWKDPRLCYTLDKWWPHLDRENTAVLLVLRDRDAIFNSFVRVGWRKDTRSARAKTYQRTDEHIASAKRIIGELGIPHGIIEYADFEKNPLLIKNIMADVFDFDVDISAFGYDKKYNHNNLIGSISTRIDKLVTGMPDRPRKFLKSLVPTNLLKKLFPERYK